MAPLRTDRLDRPATVLIADDHQDIRELLGHALTRAGFRVWIATNGGEAVGLYRAHQGKIDVVLLDVQMPVMDGRAALAELLALAPALPCCFLTGLPPANEEDLLALGACRVFTKPFDPTELAAVLRALCDQTCDTAARRGTAGPTRRATENC